MLPFKKHWFIQNHAKFGISWTLLCRKDHYIRARKNDCFNSLSRMYIIRVDDISIEAVTIDEFLFDNEIKSLNKSHKNAPCVYFAWIEEDRKCTENLVGGDYLK